VLDLAEAAVAWALPLEAPQPALRALVSGYQALRRLAPEERDGLWHAVRLASAREGARRLLAGREGALQPLEACERLGPDEVRAAAG
jgi:Ser/Thr protein kinase RdoA (MazF antagonist)